MKARLVVLAIGLTMGWVGASEYARLNRTALRQELAQEMGRNHQLTRACFDDLKNQYTPGYRSSAPLWRMENQQEIIVTAQGEIFKTQSPTNVAINGSGFLVARQQNGDYIFTRDGRLNFQEGSLCYQQHKVLGYDLKKGDSSLVEIKLELDPITKLYGGLFTGYHFDQEGTLHGEKTSCDPVTGQTITTNLPLYQLALAAFEAPHKLLRKDGTGFIPSAHSGAPIIGKAHQGIIGEICPGSLEMSNVDFMETGLALNALKTRAGLLSDVPRSAADPQGPIGLPSVMPYFQAPSTTQPWTSPQPSNPTNVYTLNNAPPSHHVPTTYPLSELLKQSQPR